MFNHLIILIMYVKICYKLLDRPVVEEFEGYPDWYNLTRAIEKRIVSGFHIDLALKKEDLQ